MEVVLERSNELEVFPNHVEKEADTYLLRITDGALYISLDF